MALEILSRPHVGRSAWWSVRLGRMKTSLRQTRRRMQTARRRRIDFDNSCRDYFVQLQTYKQEILAAKSVSWTNFVNQELSQDPWGVVYKLAAEKLKLCNMSVTVKKQDDTKTLQLQDTLDEVVNRLMPLDCELTYSQTHEEVRAKLNTFTGDHLRLTEITDGDLTAAVGKISSYKAPGSVRVHGKIIQLYHPNIKDNMLRLYQACLRFKYFATDWKHGQESGVTGKKRNGF